MPVLIASTPDVAGIVDDSDVVSHDDQADRPAAVASAIYPEANAPR
jgi:hypothetical protein